MIILAWQQGGGGLTPAQRAVRERFQEGGSAMEALLIVLIIAAAVVLAYFVTTLLHKSERPRQVNDPKQLFHDLLGKLNLTAPQREFLAAVVKDLGLKDPAVILLSPALFDRHIDQWQQGQLRSGVVAQVSSRKQLVDQTRRVLFPDS